jgi:hypothetical protein
MKNYLLELPATIPGITNEDVDTQLLKLQTQKFLSQINPVDFSSLKKTPVKFKLIKRLSPFLLFEFILPVIFIYLISTGKGVNILFQLGLFLFLEINMMVFDFAFWNYWEGKRQIRMWLVEAPLVFLIFYFLV